MPKGAGSGGGGTSCSMEDECCSIPGSSRGGAGGLDEDCEPVGNGNYPAGDGRAVPPPLGYPGSMKRKPWGE